MVVSESTLSPGSFARPAGDVVVVYDGECPFCRNFVALQKLRQNVGTVTLVDARDHLEDVGEAKRAGLDLDQGMLVFWRGNIYEGGDAVHILSALGAERGVFTALTRLAFSKAAVARGTYPALRAARNATLRLLGRRKLSSNQ